MKVSTKGRYGLRAMVELASMGEGESLSLKTIAERQGISEGYLEQLVAPLKKAGLVKSIRGSQGGYVILKPPREITAGDVLRVMEGALLPTDCSSVNPNIHCVLSGACATKIVWQRMADAINEVVDSINLEDLAKEHRAQLVQLEARKKTEQ